LCLIPCCFEVPMLTMVSSIVFVCLNFVTIIKKRSWRIRYSTTSFKAKCFWSNGQCDGKVFVHQSDESKSFDRRRNEKSLNWAVRRMRITHPRAQQSVTLIYIETTVFMRCRCSAFLNWAFTYERCSSTDSRNNTIWKLCLFRNMYLCQLKTFLKTCFTQCCICWIFPITGLQKYQ
jgi:hypothetical protein